MDRYWINAAINDAIFAEQRRAERQGPDARKAKRRHSHEKEPSEP